MEMHQSVPFTQAIKPNTGPRSQRIATDFVIFDFKPATVESARLMHVRIKKEIAKYELNG